MRKTPSFGECGFLRSLSLFIASIFLLVPAVSAFESTETVTPGAHPGFSDHVLPVAGVGGATLQDGADFLSRAGGSDAGILVLAKAAGAAMAAARRLKLLEERVWPVDLEPADTLLAKGGLENIRRSLDLYREAVELEPDNFEANWKCARALSRYAETAAEDGLENWKEFCRVYGEEGLHYGQKAIKLRPERVEGYLYYGSCVWDYAQGVGLMQSWKENLKAEAQGAMERAYATDKTFDRGEPIKVLGVFWYELPWPLRDYETSLRYWEEYHAAFPDDDEGRHYLAQTLVKLDREEEAEELLKQANESMLVLQQNRERYP